MQKGLVCRISSYGFTSPGRLLTKPALQNPEHSNQSIFLFFIIHKTVLKVAHFVPFNAESEQKDEFACSTKLYYFSITTLTMKQSKLFPTNEPEVLDKIPFETAQTLGKAILTILSKHMKPCALVGSVRRKKEFCRDLDFVGVASPKDFDKAFRAVKKEFKTEIKVKGDKVTRFLIDADVGRVQVDLYNATPETFGIHKLIRTGSAEHNMWLASFAISLGFRLKYSEGLMRLGLVCAGDTEESVFEALGLPCPKPEEREIENNKPIWFECENSS